MHGESCVALDILNRAHAFEGIFFDHLDQASMSNKKASLIRDLTKFIHDHAIDLHEPSKGDWPFGKDPETGLYPMGDVANWLRMKSAERGSATCLLAKQAKRGTYQIDEYLERFVKRQGDRVYRIKLERLRLDVSEAAQVSVRYAYHQLVTSEKEHRAARELLSSGSALFGTKKVDSIDRGVRCAGLPRTVRRRRLAIESPDQSDRSSSKPFRVALHGIGSHRSILHPHQQAARKNGPAYRCFHMATDHSLDKKNGQTPVKKQIWSIRSICRRSLERCEVSYSARR